MKKIRILSIDGGGIRGVIPAVILLEVEKIIREFTGNEQAKLADYFDFIAGTSTGGILTGIYLCPDENNHNKARFTAEQAVELYMRRGPQIFNASSWKRFTSLGGLNEEIYSEESLEKYLKTYFRDIKMSEMVKPCLITAYEIEKRHPYFFTRDDARTIPGRDFYMRDVTRATSAAPIYFKASQIVSTSGEVYSFIDGGMFANNPAMCALTEVIKNYTSGETSVSIGNILMLSLGTGIKKTPIEYKEAKEYGALNWIKPILHILSSGNNETVDYQVSRLFMAAGATNQYLRLSPSLKFASSELDDASPENLKALHDEGYYCAKENIVTIKRFVELLIKEENDLTQ